MDAPKSRRQKWLDLVVEDVIEPERPIIDPHHHLWPAGEGMRYGLEDLHRDTGDGHEVVHTVFVECHAAYHPDGPIELRPVGETEFVARAAGAESTGLIAGIVARADLRIDNLGDVLDAHVAASNGLLKGIRDPLARADGTTELWIAGDAPEGKFDDDAFIAGVRHLGDRGLPYDSWHYHYQNRELLALARSAPATTIVLDHFGTPLGVGRYAARRRQIFESWRDDITALAACPNVVAKLGGMAMQDNGFGWERAERPATSDEFVVAQGRYYEHTIVAFGADRCMFESNFPMDRRSLSYRTLWNAFKKIAAGCSPDEKADLFAGTARRVYNL
ncbi:MAG: amidohydrolase [Acidimicrobiia bacterium]